MLKPESHTDLHFMRGKILQAFNWLDSKMQSSHILNFPATQWFLADSTQNDWQICNVSILPEKD